MPILSGTQAGEKRWFPVWRVRGTALAAAVAVVLFAGMMTAQAVPTTAGAGPAVPTALPSTLPVSTPAAPSAEPSHRPSGRPTGKPTSKPAPHPTRSRPAPTRSKPARTSASPAPSTSATKTKSKSKSKSKSKTKTKPSKPAKVNPIDLKAGARAQAAKNRADRRVATLAQRIAAEARRVQSRSVAAALAEQRYSAQLAVQARARATAAAASRRVDEAQRAYQRDQQSLAATAAAAYESYTGPESLGVTTLGTLLIADDPSAVLDTDSEQRMLVAHQAAVVGQVRIALQTLRSAQHDRSVAVAAVVRETSRLTAIRAQAEAALTDAQRTVAALTAQLRSAKVSQKVADAALSSFLGGWSTADPKRAQALNVAYAKLALENKHVRPAPAGPVWTAAMGRTAVERALLYLGTNYAWAGGNADGPTRGVCAAGDAHLDCRYIGFDCSGLALYAWAPYVSMPHFAAYQYNFGSVHPSPGQLRPGDLVFWSSDGTAAGIHHVAIYVGDGNVIQAPQSGDIVRITPIGSVSSDYFGAVRPLS